MTVEKDDAANAEDGNKQDDGPQPVKPRRGFLSSAFGLDREEMPVGKIGFATQLRRLTRLMKLELTNERRRDKFSKQFLDLIQGNPGLASFRFKVDEYEELLLHQIMYKKPSFDLFHQLYKLNPQATQFTGYGNYNVLHHACWGHVTVEIVDFLVREHPDLCRGAPFPPLLSAVDAETEMEVLECLVKAYPQALCACDISSITALDMALMDKLSMPVFQLFVTSYPEVELKITERAGMVRIPPALANLFACDHERIRILDGTHMRFSAFGWVTFLSKLAQNNTLTELVIDLSEAEVDQETCDAMLLFLSKNRALKRLSLRGKLLPTALGRCLAKGVAENQTLESLIIATPLDGINAGEVLGSVEFHPAMNSLAFSHMTTPGVDWRGLSNLVLIQKLDLADCLVGVDLAEPLAALLENTELLQDLNVRNNRIGDQGSVIVANALQKNVSLLRLDYSHNEIGETGWLAFLDMLQHHNVTIRSIQFARDDGDYASFNSKLQYYCDQNVTGRKLSPSSEVIET